MNGCLYCTNCRTILHTHALPPLLASSNQSRIGSVDQNIRCLVAPPPTQSDKDRRRGEHTITLWRNLTRGVQERRIDSKIWIVHTATRTPAKEHHSGVRGGLNPRGTDRRISRRKTMRGGLCRIQDYNYLFKRGCASSERNASGLLAWFILNRRDLNRSY